MPKIISAPTNSRGQCSSFSQTLWAGARKAFTYSAFIIYSVSVGLRHRRLASQNLEEYFLAGRTLRGWRAGISMAATQYAADTPLLVTGLIATAGLFALWRLWVYGIAFLLMGFVLAALWRRAGVLTDAELTEVRYQGNGAAVLRAVRKGVGAGAPLESRGVDTPPPGRRPGTNPGGDSLQPAPERGGQASPRVSRAAVRDRRLA
ncbi:MAG: hypothetical protein IIC21_08415 [Chloroflexi bacterium]|nr:hypothetical protein [Chloroflexota bacterium]